MPSLCWSGHDREPPKKCNLPGDDRGGTEQFRTSRLNSPASSGRQNKYVTNFHFRQHRRYHHASNVVGTRRAASTAICLAVRGLQRHLIRPPRQCEPFLANAAGCKNEKRPVWLSPGLAHRSDDADAKSVGLAEGTHFVAQTGTGIWRVKTDAGQNLAGIGTYGRRASEAGREFRKALAELQRQRAIDRCVCAVKQDQVVGRVEPSPNLRTNLHTQKTNLNVTTCFYWWAVLGSNQ